MRIFAKISFVLSIAWLVIGILTEGASAYSMRADPATPGGRVSAGVLVMYANMDLALRAILVAATGVWVTVTGFRDRAQTTER